MNLYSEYLDKNDGKINEQLSLVLIRMGSIFSFYM